MDRKERKENRKKCITSGTYIAILGMAIAILTAILRMFGVSTNMSFMFITLSILLIVAGAIYPTIFVIFRNKWLVKNNLWL